MGAAWLLGAVSALSIGLAGVLAWPVAALFGQDYIAPDRPNQVLSADRCRVLLAAYPRAGSCQLAS